MSPRYRAAERQWVRALLLRLTAAERAVYEERLRQAHASDFKGIQLDLLKASIAERIIAERKT